MKPPVVQLRGIVQPTDVVLSSALITAMAGCVAASISLGCFVKIRLKRLAIR